MLHLKKAATQDLPVYDRILSTALDLFVERGYHNVSIHDIQKLANVSIGSIYNHFGGKEGVAKALYYHLIREMEELVADVIDENLSFRESCNRIISLLFEYTESKRNIVAYVLHAKHQEFLPDEPPICSSTPFKTMRNIVQRGMESGEIREGDPWVVASGIFGGAIRLIHLRLDGVLNVPLPELYDELIDCMWHGMEPISIQESVA
ncbi:MAG: TetR/AcrR family transcriptional regulator [Candidatus Thiodiazotropha lotti]|uniref:TetR family transcriptional regulator n=1 Tax=Candidatus Thiodiazotropha endoloripes TaxID=1818881 RepID=A0A1E2URK3_9GAMM|nr:TetR/AcrR family transcriptional regulator [Candidatus Thiodiazotropha endoloripes]MCG7897516.1 TetR/AcrR family transcriptional regulator [Candidatus Thiodiazotropha weberae]MCG7990230.1 TetR/AcrR family transcriptional regulator [Candidatus Thiodiazotropha lotti]MCG7902100.1 TetR/AcrR family transcriptional regulator [Candidatus Thiodiazotropha weberae]MCG7914029.1 TetR/AcrR family transcriptional regulator [Candidatus Thiodiazotropha weberae]MCG7999134.1 TetR/AcrR family transcriptional 